MTLFTGGLFAYMIMLAEIEALHIPKSVWLIAVVILACVWSIKTIQPFVRKEKYEGKTEDELYHIIWEQIKKLNTTFPRYKHIQNMILSSEELIKTTTKKVKRQEEMKLICKK